jgi:hypothetical protein
MKKCTLFLLILGSLLASAASAQGGDAADINRRNTKLSSLCDKIMQVKYNYEKLPSADLASKRRQNNDKIEACYQMYRVTSSALP